MTRPVRRFLQFLLVLCGILFAVAYVLFWLPNDPADPAGTVITVSRGASFSAVVDSIDQKGILRNAAALRTAGRLLGLTREIKVGKYLFSGPVSNYRILKDLHEGRSRIISRVTIPEGRRLEWIASKFAREIGVREDVMLRLFRDSAEVARRGFDGSTFEGYLMPDTYAFYWQTNEEDILDRLVRQFREFYADSLVQRQRELRLSLRQVVTFASIVEAESGIGDERPVIAGVYWNRLKKHMRLEADPTIQYALPDGPRRLTYRDLNINSPYNTYRRYGLPPGPINNPGRASILAVLYPSNHRFLYFVARGDGGHRFSESYAQHLSAVRQYRQARREARRAAQARATQENVN